MRGIFAATAITTAAAIILAFPLLSGAAAAQAVPDSRAEITLSFAPVVKRAAPAVVNVYARRTVRQRGFLPFGDDPLFRHFFGDDGVFGAPRERVQNSLGSGVIVDESGFIVTNNHVIKGGTDIRVVLSDKREFEATVLLNDERTDLAVLKIDPGNEALPTPAARRFRRAPGRRSGAGNRQSLRRRSDGDERHRLGVGPHRGRHHRLSVLRADRRGHQPGQFRRRAGRHGGPAGGHQHGDFLALGGSIGIGFAIPVNMVKAVIRSSATTGRVVRPWGGVEIQEVTADIAEALGLDRPAGALVSDLHPMSPFNDAGIRRGDVIVALDDKPIESSREFNYRLATAPVGETARITWLRGGEPNSADVELIAPPEVPPREETLVQGRSPFAGLVVANLSPAVADELGLRVSSTGVVVVDVRGGPARRVGFRKGDVLVEVNGVVLDEVARLSDVITRRGRGLWDIAVERDGQLLRMQITG
jgi:S1-C subfamily serine protease